MNGVFISYRRDDSAGHAGRIHDRVARHFGHERVFRDVEDIGVGEDFVRVVEDAVGKCDVLLVVIGPQWSSVADAAGHRRLENPRDVLRLEVASALSRPDISVIPVLVGGAPMPGADELPEEIRELAFRNALEVRDTRFEDDVKHLITAIGGRKAKRFHRLALAGGLAGIPAMAVAVTILVFPSRPGIAADITLYEGTGVLTEADSSAIRAVAVPNAPPRPAAEAVESGASGGESLYRISYRYERTGDDRVRIVAALPYRELLARGGPVLGDHASIDWDWPRLSVKVVNNTDRTIQLRDIRLSIDRSEIDTEPIVMVRDMVNRAIKKFGVVNYGWGEAVAPSVRVEVVEDEACDDPTWVPAGRLVELDLDRAEVTQHRFHGVEGFSGPGAPGSELTFDVSEHVPAELEGRLLACVVGMLAYRNESGEARELRFKTLIRIQGPLVLAAVAPTAEYYLFLEAGRSGYTVSRDIPIAVPPDGVEHFLLRIGTDRSATFDMDVAVGLVGGGSIDVDQVSLELQAPVYDPQNLRDPARRR